MKTFKEYLLEQDKLKTVSIGGAEFYVFKDDDFYKNSKEPYDNEYLTFIKTIPNKRIVLDIGANVGTTAVSYSEIFDKVYAFEPVPSIFKLLKKNIEHNNINNVVLCNWGFGKENKTNKMDASNKKNMATSKIVDNEDQDAVEIEIKKLDDFDKESKNIDFVKLDIEGYEYFALEGGVKFIKKFRPIFQIEINGTHKDFDIKREQFWEFFKKLDYIAINPLLQDLKIVKSSQNLYTDIVFLPKELTMKFKIDFDLD